MSRDGKTEIPVNLVYRKDIMEKHLADGEPVHTHLYGYGSYEACMEASFSATRLALLNRGVVYAIAQIRGGGEMGRKYRTNQGGLSRWLSLFRLAHSSSIAPLCLTRNTYLE